MPNLLTVKEYKSRTKIGKALQNDKVIHCIYLITFEGSDKVYVGSATGKLGIFSRITKHFYDLKNKKHHSWKLTKEYSNNKNIYYQILEVLDKNISKDIVAIREQYWIDELDSYNNGYNATNIAIAVFKESDKEKCIKMLIENIKFFNKYGYYQPKGKGNSLGNWRISVKKDNIRKKYCIDYLLSKNLLEHLNMFDFKLKTGEQGENENVISVINFFLKNGYYPSTHSKEIKEKKLATVHGNLKRKNDKNKLYVSSLNLIKNKGIKNFFDNKNLVDAIDVIKRIVSFRKDNGFYPKRNKNDLEECFLSRRRNHFLSDKRMKNFYNELKINSEVIKILKENNCEDFWDIKIYQDKIKICKQIKKFYIKNNCLPISKDLNFKNLYIFINNTRFKFYENALDADRWCNLNGLEGILRPQENYHASRNWQPGLGRGFSWDKDWIPCTPANEWYEEVQNMSQEEIKERKIDVEFAKKEYEDLQARIPKMSKAQRKRNKVEGYE